MDIMNVEHWFASIIAASVDYDSYGLNMTQIDQSGIWITLIKSTWQIYGGRIIHVSSGIINSNLDWWWQPSSLTSLDNMGIY